MERYLLVSLKRDAEAWGVERAVETVERYLPGNYRLIAVLQEPDIDWTQTRLLEGPVAVVQGQDSCGWTLDEYVIPRLCSGLISSQEIDLSHPVMKVIPEQEEVAWITA